MRIQTRVGTSYQYRDTSVLSFVTGYRDTPHSPAARPSSGNTRVRSGLTQTDRRRPGKWYKWKRDEGSPATNYSVKVWLKMKLEYVTLPLICCLNIPFVDKHLSLFGLVGPVLLTRVRILVSLTPVLPTEKFPFYFESRTKGIRTRKVSCKSWHYLHPTRTLL